MNIIINEIFNHPILTNRKRKITEITITGDTFVECFEKIYELERKCRYDNYRWHEFLDADIQKAYQDWKRDGVTIELYYGNGVID